MFPTGQPPFPPMGQFPGFQQAAPQMMRSMAPYINAGTRGFGGFSGYGAPGFLGNTGFGSGFPGVLGGGGGTGFGAQALGAAGTAAKSGGVGWLGHMQTALKAMQSAAPMMQQYGPMLKNIPAMINMMKIMNEPDDDDDESLVSLDESSEKTSVSQDWESTSVLEKKKVKKRSQGASQPKLFI
ncbi:YqfQ family protein [Halobacillus sp. Nhm2S1]|uniref:YqfQ family protein n=1 Tax=Halobacillus sp. Nhm2S1 TaxID=2866716 RepID=UPI002105134F|nr:YqfQ family protein [Halobacillus sp. Nhm2S1]